jgi:FKBP-type peptidyl-prolyl cis-trans isomerase
MKVFKIFLGIASLGIAFSACNSVDFKKTSAGVPYKIIGSNKGDTIGVGNIVRFHLIQKTKDTVLGNTYSNGGPQYMQIQAQATSAEHADIGANFNEVFRKARKGDSLHFVFSADSLMKKFPDLGKQIPLKKGDNLIITARILDVYKTPDEARAASEKDRIASSAAREKQAIEDLKKDTAFQNSLTTDNRIIEAYLGSKGIKTTKSDLGVYVETLQNGTGPKPQPGQYVTLNYRGTDINGVEFDKGTIPDMQIGMGGTIPGFENGIKQLNKGAKANIYIPSALGYGTRGAGEKIKPNQVLLFNIEILEISDRPMAQGPMQAPQGHSKDDGHGH